MLGQFHKKIYFLNFFVGVVFLSFENIKKKKIIPKMLVIDLYF